MSRWCSYDRIIKSHNTKEERHPILEGKPEIMVIILFLISEYFMTM